VRKRGGGSKPAGGVWKRRAAGVFPAGSVKRRLINSGNRMWAGKRKPPASRKSGVSVAGGWKERKKAIREAPGRAGKFVLKHTVGRMWRALKKEYKRKKR